MRGTVKDTAAGSNVAVQNPMVLRRLRVDWAVETTRKIKDNKVESLCEEEATVHAVTLMDITLANRHVAGKVLETRLGF